MKLVTSSGTFGWCQPKTERVPAEDLGAARRPCSVAQKLVPGHHQHRRCSRQCSQTSAVPASSLAARCRRRSAAAAVSLRNWRQLPFNGTCAPAASAAACHVSSGFTSVCCTAAIALLCRADRFSPSTLSVTMRRMLYAVCPCCVTDSAAASLFVYNLPLLIGSAGAAQKGDKRVRHFGRVFTLPYRMQCPLCCVAARARSMSD